MMRTFIQYSSLLSPRCIIFILSIGLAMGAVGECCASDSWSTLKAYTKSIATSCTNAGSWFCNTAQNCFSWLSTNTHTVYSKMCEWKHSRYRNKLHTKMHKIIQNLEKNKLYIDDLLTIQPYEIVDEIERIQNESSDDQTQMLPMRLLTKLYELIKHLNDFNVSSTNIRDLYPFTSSLNSFNRLTFGLNRVGNTITPRQYLLKLCNATEYCELVQRTDYTIGCQTAWQIEAQLNRLHEWLYEMRKHAEKNEITNEHVSHSINNDIDLGKVINNMMNLTAGIIHKIENNSHAFINENEWNLPLEWWLPRKWSRGNNAIYRKTFGLLSLHHIIAIAGAYGLGYIASSEYQFGSDTNSALLHYTHDRVSLPAAAAGITYIGSFVPLSAAATSITTYIGSFFNSNAS